MVVNGVMFQFFEWYVPEDGNHWNRLKADAKQLAQAGITAIWIPPAYKATGGVKDVGYGSYDLFDLGEFNQKGTVRTKYGTKQQLLDAIQEVKAQGLQVYADVVLNHKDGGDLTEEVLVQEMDWKNRNNPVSSWYNMRAYTHFTFPGRGNTYSSMQWHWWHFDALTYNADTQKADKLYRLKDRNYRTEVSPEHGNYDFLMACDLDMGEGQVDGELRYWGRWLIDTTGVDGFRIDAVKHIRASFFRNWLNHLRAHFSGRELFSVGEYWSRDLASLQEYIRKTEGVMSLFDVPLQNKFREASVSGGNFDMRRILDGTLVKEQPSLAVTIVENHDTQPLQMLENVVEPWFKPLAYALILLRQEGYPCIFYGDYYGTQYKDSKNGKEYEIFMPSHRFLIDKFLWARQAYGFGDQHDYFDHVNTIGWTRLGNQAHPGAMAVIMSDGPAGQKWMNVHRPHTQFRDWTGHIKDVITTNDDGWGNFHCLGGSVSVWLTV